MDYFTVEKILWKKMIAGKEVWQGCWVMKGRTTKMRYQSVWHDYRAYKVHIVSVVHTLGRNILPGMTVDHVCLTKGCWNPRHLEEVSRGERGALTRWKQKITVRRVAAYGQGR